MTLSRSFLNYVSQKLASELSQIVTRRILGMGDGESQEVVVMEMVVRMEIISIFLLISSSQPHTEGGTNDPF